MEGRLKIGRGQKWMRQNFGDSVKQEDSKRPMMVADGKYAGWRRP